MRRNGRSAETEQEIHGYMPAGFVQAYMVLVMRALAGGDPKSQFGKENYGMGYGKRGQKPIGNGGLGDPRALDVKKQVDRDLRRMARQLGLFLEGKMDAADVSTRPAPLPCRACARYCSADWAYCSWCGTPTEKSVKETDERRMERNGK